jgi:hypothetical protein
LVEYTLLIKSKDTIVPELPVINSDLMFWPRNGAWLRVNGEDGVMVAEAPDVGT